MKRVFWLLLLLLPACSHLADKIATTTDLQLLSPASGPAPQTLQNKVTFSQAAKQQTFIALTEMRYQQTRVIVMTPTSQSILEMQYDGEHFHWQNRSQSPLPAKEILAMMQLALWPDSGIKKVYAADKGWTVSVTQQQRRLLRHGEPWVTMNQQAQQMTIEHHQHNYQLQIAPLEQD